MRYNIYACDVLAPRHMTKAHGGALMIDIIPQVHHNQICGVYEIVNTVNGKRYIGSSVDISSRFRHHKNELQKGIHRNPRLQNAWKKYGKEYFIFNLLIRCDAEMTLTYEQICLDSLHPEYNIAPHVDTPMRGRIVSEEIREKLRIAGIGKRQPHSEETKRKIGIANMGNTYSLGYKHTDDAKKKISIGNKGKVRSEEQRKHLSESCMGRPSSLKGKPMPKEWNQRAHEAQKGKKRRPHSEETRQKMSEARKKYWEKQRLVNC